MWPNPGNRQVKGPPPAHHHPAAKIEIFIDYARPWTSRAASVKLSGRLQAPHWRWHPRKCPDLQKGRTEYGNVLGNWVTQSAWCVLPVRLWACVPECLCGCVRVSVCPVPVWALNLCACVLVRLPRGRSRFVRVLRCAHLSCAPVCGACLCVWCACVSDVCVCACGSSAANFGLRHLYACV